MHNNVTGSKGLAIRLDDADRLYKPGDVISGHVFRQVPILVGEKDVTVTVRFGGRSRVRMYGWLDNTPESDVERESTFELIDPGTTLQTLHKGPLDIPRTISGLPDDELDGGAVSEEVGKWWPFTVTVPAHTSAASTIDDMFRAQVLGETESSPEYVAVDETRKAISAALPPHTAVHGVGKPGYGVPGLNMHGRVYYFIEASLVSGRSNNKPLAVATVKLESDPEPIPDALRSHTIHANHKLSFTSKGLYERDVSVQVSTSAVYSIRETTPLAFILSGLRSRTGSAKSLELVIKSFNLTVEEECVFWAGPDYMSRGEDSCVTNYTPEQSVPSSQSRLTVPSEMGADPVDLGRLFGVRLDKVTTVGHSSGEGVQLSPDFATYNIKRSHKLSWEIGMDVAGKAGTLSGKQSIVLV